MIVFGIQHHQALYRKKRITFLDKRGCFTKDLTIFAASKKNINKNYDKDNIPRRLCS